MTAYDWFQVAYALTFMVVVPIVWWKRNFR